MSHEDFWHNQANYIFDTICDLADNATSQVDMDDLADELQEWFYKLYIEVYTKGFPER